jgi:uncharacterized protein YkwD
VNIKKIILAFYLLISLVLGMVYAQQPNTAFEQRTFELINIERSKHGLPHFIWNDTVAAIARSQSANSNAGQSSLNLTQMLREGIATYISHSLHTNNSGNTPEQRVEAWMNSDSGRSAILHQTRNSIGIGVVRESGSNTRNYWTMIVAGVIELTSSEIQSFERRVLELTNVERAKHNLPPLIWHDDLTVIAREHSADLMLNNMQGHIGSDGSTIRERIERGGVTNLRFWAENCAYGQITPEQAVEAWMNSPGHRANILNVNPTHLGVGLVLRSDGSSATRFVSYWTQVFVRFR